MAEPSDSGFRTSPLMRYCFAKSLIVNQIRLFRLLAFSSELDFQTFQLYLQVCLGTSRYVYLLATLAKLSTNTDFLTVLAVLAFLLLLSNSIVQLLNLPSFVSLFSNIKMHKGQGSSGPKGLEDLSHFRSLYVLRQICLL